MALVNLIMTFHDDNDNDDDDDDNDDNDDDDNDDRMVVGCVSKW